MRDQMDYLKPRDVMITLPTTELWMDCYQAIPTEKLLGIPESQNRWRLVPYNHYIPPYSVAVFWAIDRDKQGITCEIKHLESATFIPEPISFEEPFQAVFVLESVWQDVSFCSLPANDDDYPIWVTRKYGPDVLLVPCGDGTDWALLHLKEDSFHAAGCAEMLSYHQMVNFLIEESIEWVALEPGCSYRKPYRDDDDRSES